MGNISYSAVVLTPESRQRLLRKFQGQIPEGWEVIAHHMTINMGEIAPEFAKYLGLPANLVVEDFAMDDKVMAVGVSGFESQNIKPHITIAVNRKAGGKPMMSNKLTNWKKINKPLSISGIVTEVEYR